MEFDHDGAAEGVEGGRGGGVGVGVGFGCGVLLLARGARVAEGVVPALARLGGVVAVVDGLRPRIEVDGGEGAVGKIGADESAERVVAHQRRHAPFDEDRIVFVLLGLREVRLVLLDGVALVVHDGATGADPARIGRGVEQLALPIELRLAVFVEVGRRACLGAHFGHDFLPASSEVAVGGEPAAVAGAVGLAMLGLDARHHERGRWAFLGPLVAVEVVGVPHRRIDQRVAARAGEGDVGHAAERVEGDFGVVAVDVGHGVRRQRPVVQGGRHGAIERVGDGGDEQLVAVVGDARRVSERVVDRGRQGEVGERVVVLGARDGPKARGGAVGHSAGGGLEARVAAGIDVAAAVGGGARGRGGGDPAVEDATGAEHARGERHGVAGVREQVVERLGAGADEGVVGEGAGADLPVALALVGEEALLSGGQGVVVERDFGAVELGAQARP